MKNDVRFLRSMVCRRRANLHKVTQIGFRGVVGLETGLSFKGARAFSEAVFAASCNVGKNDHLSNGRTKTSLCMVLQNCC